MDMGQMLMQNLTANNPVVAQVVRMKNSGMSPQQALQELSKQFPQMQAMQNGAGINQIGMNMLREAIPDTTTINAPVYITIGAGTELYPLTKRNCAQVTACGIRTRTRYSTCVSTSSTGGSFRMLGQPCCAPSNNLSSINGTAPGGAAA